MDWPTIIVSAVIVAIVAAIIICSIRGKKKGKGSCGCSCSGCAMSGMCHGHHERSNK
ncbi:MAG: FeoB-associated Cys-rich membrane protein [Clostridia bacterium]|nr:FeoB-associated Cys-rich membrane protein [Clostridia bacterium]